MTYFIQFTYEAAVQEMNVTAAVFWNGDNQLDDIHEFTGKFF